MNQIPANGEPIWDAVANHPQNHSAMTLPRSQLVNLDTTPYYHITSRCVRQQFLCGRDPETGRDFSHRREWIRSRVRLAASAFAIEVHAYAIMSNHFHLVVRIAPSKAVNWSDREVVRRWRQVYQGPPVIDRYVQGQPMSRAERVQLHVLIKTYRARLASISWFMRAINQPIARMANREDDVTGHFWEGRYRSQALLSDRAVLAAMAYVDLNPIRAGLATTPEQSNFTSVQDRIRQRIPLDEPLLPVFGSQDSPSEAPLSVGEYLNLVDWSGRAVASGKPGKIPRALPGIFQRLDLQPEGYVRFVSQSNSRACIWFGPAESIRTVAARLNRKFLRGRSLRESLFYSSRAKPA